jgi:hypothetical protein
MDTVHRPAAMSSSRLRAARPRGLGRIADDRRSEPLAITWLIPFYSLLSALPRPGIPDFSPGTLSIIRLR